MIDYYVVTSDHLVPADEINPEVLQTDIIETEDGAGVGFMLIHGCHLL